MGIKDFTVTIILPVYNEAAYIEKCLDAIALQDFQPLNQMEVLVVDGMSTDGTREIVREFSLQHPKLNIRLLDNPGRIVPTGMNLAMRKARGEIIIRVDGHCIIARDYVRQCLIHMLNDSVDGVGGPMDTIGETSLSDSIAVAMSSPFGVGNSAFRTVKGKTMLADTVPFPAYSRRIIEQAGGYDEELVRNQDDEYNYRIRKLGGKILLAEDVRSKYFSRGSYLKLWKQYYQYGFYKVRVLQKHPRQMSPRQFIPGLFVTTLIVSAVLGLVSVWGQLLLGAVLAAYLVANLAATVITAARWGWRHLVHLPITFGILHLSYGTGFLAGMLHFRERWGDKIGKVPTLESSFD